MTQSYSMPPELLAITNNRQREFCRLVALEGLPAYKAYIEAGYSEKGADQASSRLLRNVKVSTAITALQEQAYSQSFMSRAEMIALQAKIARGNMGDFVDDEGNVDIKALKKSAVITKLKIKRRITEEGHEVEDLDLTMADPQKALKDLAALEAMNKQPEPPKPDPEEGKNAILQAMRAIDSLNKGIDPKTGKDLSLNKPT